MANMNYIYRLLAVSLVLATVLFGTTPRENQRTFATPQEAVQAIIDAAEHNDAAALLQLFGPDGKDILESGNPVEDKESRAEFARLFEKAAKRSRRPEATKRLPPAP